MKFTTAELRSKAQSERLQKSLTTASILRESRAATAASYDVFLSHSILDAELIHGAKKALEDYGLTVYVDWIDDPQLDRSDISPATANHLRLRMKLCKMLVYAHTENSAQSKWCPWELGYYDGMRGGNVFLLPIVQSASSSFVGQEYVGLYPYLDHLGSTIFINGSPVGVKTLREAKTKIISTR